MSKENFVSFLFFVLGTFCIVALLGYIYKPMLDKKRADVPVQYSTTGADGEYRHGHHCIDMRAF